jgi:hypothetical protein
MNQDVTSGAADRQFTIARLVNEVRDSRKIRVSQSAASTSEAIAPGIADGTPLDQWYLKFENQFRDVPPEPAAPAEFAPTALPSISLASGPITFGGGVPVGGWSNLSLYPNGWFNFVGHFHDSGAPSYNVDHVWSIWSPGHGLIMIGTQGHMAGTFESGSRDFNWNIQQLRPDIAAEWANLSRGYSWQWNSHVQWDVAAAMQSIKNGIQAAVQIAQVIMIIV